MTTITKDEVVDRLGSVTVIDVRTREEWSGELGAPCDPRQGHIPGARCVPLQDLFGLGPDAVRQLVGEPVGSAVVAYCHSGSRSALAADLLRQAGYDAVNYVGSWHEWSRDDQLGIEKG